MKLTIILISLFLLSCAHDQPKENSIDYKAWLSEKGLLSKPGSCNTIDTCVYRIKQKITRNWRQPCQVLKGKSVTVNIGLDSSGELTAMHVKESSGYDILDRSAVDAVKASVPFDFLHELSPQAIENVFSNFQIVFVNDGTCFE